MLKKIILGIIIGLSISGVAYAVDMLIPASIISYESSYTDKTNVADVLSELLEEGGKCIKGFDCSYIIHYAGLKWKIVSQDDDGITLILANNYTTGAFDENNSTSFEGSTSFNTLNTTLLNDDNLLQEKINNNELISMGNYNGNSYYVRLPEKSELSEEISNYSGKPFLTQTINNEMSSVYFGGADGLEGKSYTISEESTFYQGYSSNLKDIAKKFITSVSVIDYLKANQQEIYTGYETKQTYAAPHYKQGASNQTNSGFVRHYCFEGGPTSKKMGIANIYVAGCNGVNDAVGYCTLNSICNQITYYILNQSEPIGIRPVIKVKKI